MTSSKLPASNNVRWLSDWLSLFSSFGTLLCCAIPSLLVALGMGATLVGLVGKFPQLVWLSEHKAWLFGSSLTLLFITFFVRRWADKQPCPIEAREACMRTKKWSGIVYWSAVAINVIGVLVTFVMPRLLYG